MIYLLLDSAPLLIAPSFGLPLSASTLPPPFPPSVLFGLPNCSCALQYVMLHLMGYKLTIEDLKQFRQVGSITPGHPEVHVTEGELSFSSLPGCLRS
jgi:hypothetical protein